MSDDFFLTYEISAGRLLHKGVAVTRFEHRTCSGESVVFELTAAGLTWQVPFFLTDNIFYLQIGSKLIFSRHIEQFRSYAAPDYEANTLLRSHGFLPHARTQFKGVSIVCSYLSYTVNRIGISVAPLFPELQVAAELSVDDLIDVFRNAFVKQLELVNNESWVLPLSGGMDSRMLLSLALERRDIDLKLFTLGTRRSGDVKVAKAIAASLGLEGKHRILYLEDLVREDLLENYKACDYLLPLDRVLTKPFGKLFKRSAVLSGLYGDVIFADNSSKLNDYFNYYKAEGFTVHDNFDQQVVKAYMSLPQLPKLHRLLLRCQKLTRQSFPISPGFDFVTPFVKPEVVVVASNIRSKRIYPNIVSRFMRSELRGFIHQSTLSYFTHPTWLRIVERKVFKLLRHPSRAAYFDDRFLKDIGIIPNEAPPLD